MRETISALTDMVMFCQGRWHEPVQICDFKCNKALLADSGNKTFQKNGFH